MRLKDIINEEIDPRLEELEEDDGEINRLSTFTIPAKKMIASRAIGPLGARDKVGKIKPEFEDKFQIKDKSMSPNHSRDV